MLFKMDEADEEWGPIKENRICFIGRNLDKEYITEEIMACVVRDDEPLRFKLGDKVECQTADGWQKGKVVGFWGEGNPYRVTLD